MIEAYLGTGATRGGQGVSEARRAAGGPLLEIKELRTAYGAIEALKGISLEVHEGEIVTLIGANGAGKTTTLRTIYGIVRAARGQHPLRRHRHHAPPRARDRQARHRAVPRGPPPVPAHDRAREPRARRLPAATTRPGSRTTSSASYALFPRLKERETQKAGTLSGGEQQMCAIGRALMARPRLLLLDEPSMGLAPILVDRIFEIIVEINRQGTTVLLVEQNASIALSVANRGYVLETGQIKLTDDAAALRSNDEVRKLYLGEALGRGSGGAGCIRGCVAPGEQPVALGSVGGLELQPGAPRSEPARRHAHDPDRIHGAPSSSPARRYSVEPVRQAGGRRP